LLQLSVFWLRLRFLQYQNYIAKSQVSRAVAELGAVKTAVETCLNDGKTAAAACDLGWTGSSIISMTTPGTSTAELL
jgi:type IV pilus assembly protein PilA